MCSRNTSDADIEAFIANLPAAAGSAEIRRQMTLAFASVCMRSSLLSTQIAGSARPCNSQPEAGFLLRYKLRNFCVFAGYPFSSAAVSLAK